MNLLNFLKGRVKMENNKVFKVYKYTSSTTKLSYIGYTCNTLAVRSGRNGRRYSSKRNNEYIHSKFGPAIEKYGWSDFSVEILEENISSENIFEREKYWISFYDTFNNGYNSNPGGCSPKKVSTSLREFYSNQYSGSGNPRARKTVMIDIKSDKIIAIFSYAKEAVHLYPDKFKCVRHIIDCCHGIRKSAYKYKWKFYNDLTKKEKEYADKNCSNKVNFEKYKSDINFRIHNEEIIAKDDFGKIIYTFSTITEASKFIGTTNQRLKKKIINKIKINGLIWEYKNSSSGKKRYIDNCVLQFDIENNFIQEFPSVTMAASVTNTKRARNS